MMRSPSGGHSTDIAFASVVATGVVCLLAATVDLLRALLHLS